MGAVLFIATMGIAIALAVQATRAASSHRAASEAALTHHATIVAWRFAGDGRSWLAFGMNEAGSALNRAVTMQKALPGPEVLVDLLAEKECDCMTAAFGRTFFRVDNGANPQLVVRGEFVSERTKDSLLAISLAAAKDTARRQGNRQWLILPPGQPRLNRATDVALIWKVGDEMRGVLAVYGMIVADSQIERPLREALHLAFNDAHFFPASMVSDSALPALVHIDVAGPNREAMFASGPMLTARAGTDTLGAQYGDLMVTAAFAPAAADVLAGGLPTSSAATIIVMLILALSMGAGALVMLRRENRLARLREDFVSGVSHELRTPLTQIRLLSELLKTDGFRTDSERGRATDVIHREALRLSNLVDNVLEFSRSRRMPPQQNGDRVQIAEIVREVRESLDPLLEAQENKVEITGDGVEASGGREAVSRVVRNLIENAVKYGPPGQTIRVTVTPPNGASGARVTIDDEGPGIPEAERQRIWQPYYRLDRDRNVAAGGSGIGLAVVADLMRQLGGTAWVGDAPTKGARFTLEFPGTANGQ